MPASSSQVSWRSAVLLASSIATTTFFSAVSAEDTTTDLRLTDAELRAFDGQDATKPIYLAIDGSIYDVSAQPNFYGPGGQYGQFAGRDASRAWVSECWDDEDQLTWRMDDVEFMFTPRYLDEELRKAAAGEKVDIDLGDYDDALIKAEAAKALARLGEVKESEMEARRLGDAIAAKEKSDAALAHWINFFSTNPKYPKVGEVVHDETDTTSPPPLCQAALDKRPLNAGKLEYLSKLAKLGAGGAKPGAEGIVDMFKQRLATEAEKQGSPEKRDADANPLANLLGLVKSVPDVEGGEAGASEKQPEAQKPSEEKNPLAGLLDIVKASNANSANTGDSKKEGDKDPMAGLNVLMGLLNGGAGGDKKAGGQDPLGGLTNILKGLSNNNNNNNNNNGNGIAARSDKPAAAAGDAQDPIANLMKAFSGNSAGGDKKADAKDPMAGLSSVMNLLSKNAGGGQKKAGDKDPLSSLIGLLGNAGGQKKGGNKDALAGLSGLMGLLSNNAGGNGGEKKTGSKDGVAGLSALTGLLANVKGGDKKTTSGGDSDAFAGLGGLLKAFTEKKEDGSSDDQANALAGMLGMFKQSLEAKRDKLGSSTDDKFDGVKQNLNAVERLQSVRLQLEKMREEMLEEREADKPKDPLEELEEKESATTHEEL